MTTKQMIISIGREYGSGGHDIAEAIAERFALPLYDKNILHEIADKKDLNVGNLAKYDELPKKKFFSRTIKGYNNSPEENIANMQFEYLKSKAEKGESFVIVGRCAETILKGYDGLISFFILADMDQKIKRIASINQLSENEAKDLISYYNRKRKAYHNRYCDIKWGDSRNYDISINSSKLGIEETTNIVESYIKQRIQ